MPNAMNVAWSGAVAALTLGVISIVSMLQMPGPLQLCAVLPPHCILTGHLTGADYFWGEGPSAPAFHLRLVAGPVLSIAGAYVASRGHLWTGIALAGTSAMVVGLPQLLGTYALVPLHPLVFAATSVTSGSLLVVAAGKESGAARQR